MNQPRHVARTLRSLAPAVLQTVMALTLPLFISCARPPKSSRRTASATNTPFSWKVLQSPDLTGYYVLCSGISELKACDGQLPQAVLFNQEIEDAYRGLGLKACENAFVRYRLAYAGIPPGYVIPRGGYKRIAPWQRSGPSRRAVLMAEVLTMEPASQHTECKAAVGDIDQIRTLVEDAKPLLVEGTKRWLFANGWLTECTTIASDRWDLMEIDADNVKVHIQVYSQCRDRTGNDAVPLTGDRTLDLQKEGQVWRRKPSGFLDGDQTRR
ncbi:MAG: hypothetical protein NEA02_16695 [Thermoanaerobaculia bacterium]|nr:hypothetical protein [Thermoanaerobaculia bacterium]